MEKESLINSLKERIGENDFAAISRRSVETIIEPLLPMFADDDKVTDDTYALPVALLKSFIGQSRHDIADAVKAEKNRLDAEKDKAVKDAVDALKAEYENRDKGPDPKPADPKPADTDINGIVAAEVQKALQGLTGDDGALGKLTNSFNTFINDYNRRKTEETEASVRQRITKGLEELGADKGKVIELALRDLSFGDKSYDDLFKEAKANYETLYKELYSNGPMPFAGGSGDADSVSGFKSFLQRKQELADRQEKDAEALRTKMM